VGSSGKHRPTSLFRFRKSLIAAGVVLAVAAAAGWAIAAAGKSSSQKVAAQSAQDQADLAYRSQDRAARSAPRTPVSSASPTKTAKATLEAKPKRKAKRSPAKTAARKVVRSGSCQASYYGEGEMTASGESFDPSELTAAHKSLSFGTKVRVINKNNGDSIVVRINDRGPFVSGRCLDLSTAAMRAVGGVGSGVIPVQYQVLADA
jgi:rare lipoprotein A